MQNVDTVTVEDGTEYSAANLPHNIQQLLQIRRMYVDEWASEKHILFKTEAAILGIDTEILRLTNEFHKSL